MQAHSTTEWKQFSRVKGHGSPCNRGKPDRKSNHHHRRHWFRYHLDFVQVPIPSFPRNVWPYTSPTFQTFLLLSRKDKWSELLTTRVRGSTGRIRCLECAENALRPTLISFASWSRSNWRINQLQPPLFARNPMSLPRPIAKPQEKMI